MSVKLPGARRGGRAPGTLTAPAPVRQGRVGIRPGGVGPPALPGRGMVESTDLLYFGQQDPVGRDPTWAGLRSPPDRLFYVVWIKREWGSGWTWKLALHLVDCRGPAATGRGTADTLSGDGPASQRGTSNGRPSSRPLPRPPR
jgi:hypothetical protein